MAEEVTVGLPMAFPVHAVADFLLGPEVVQHWPLGQIQVNDARSAAAGSAWVATAISTAFTPTAGPAIAASAVSYAAGSITKVGTAEYAANNQGDLTAVVPAVTATGITGDNSETWNPTIAVAVPGGMAAGTYSATITESVS